MSLQHLTTQQIQQQLDCANTDLEIILSATTFELHQELSRRSLRPIIQDEQEDIDDAKGWELAHTENGF